MEQFAIRPESSPWLALLGDVNDSRAAPDRELLRQRLREALAVERRSLGGDAGGALAAGFEITAGDEFTSIFRPRPGWGMTVIDSIRNITEAVLPSGMAFGLGWGELTTEPRGSVRELDGPCFHRAREALGEAKRRSAWVVSRGLPGPVDAVLDGLLGLAGAVRGRWTGRQAEFARHARHELQKEVASRFGVTPPVVSESLRAASWRAVCDAEDAAASLLDWAVEEAP